MRQFITNMLNIQDDKIEELQTIAQSDGSIIINLKLYVSRMPLFVQTAFM